MSGWLSTRNKTKIQPKQGRIRKTAATARLLTKSKLSLILASTSPPSKQLFTATRQSSLSQFFITSKDAVPDKDDSPDDHIVDQACNDNQAPTVVLEKTWNKSALWYNMPHGDHKHATHVHSDMPVASQSQGSSLQLNAILDINSVQYDNDNGSNLEPCIRAYNCLNANTKCTTEVYEPIGKCNKNDITGESDSELCMNDNLNNKLDGNCQFQGTLDAKCSISNGLYDEHKTDPISVTHSKEQHTMQDKSGWSQCKGQIQENADLELGTFINLNDNSGACELSCEFKPNKISEYDSQTFDQSDNELDLGSELVLESQYDSQLTGPSLRQSCQGYAFSNSENATNLTLTEHDDGFNLNGLIDKGALSKTSGIMEPVDLDSENVKKRQLLTSQCIISPVAKDMTYSDVKLIDTHDDSSMPGGRVLTLFSDDSLIVSDDKLGCMSVSSEAQWTSDGKTVENGGYSTSERYLLSLSNWKTANSDFNVCDSSESQVMIDDDDTSLTTESTCVTASDSLQLTNVLPSQSLQFPDGLSLQL